MPKVILISGGSDGLGKAIAKKLVPNNQVVILAHNKTKLEAAAKELGCDFVEAELTDFGSLQSAIDQVLSKYHQIDVLVNNAGVWMEGELDENDAEKIKNLIDVNTTGTIFLTKAVLPKMRLEKSGQIINIISQDGLCAKKSRSVYHASKWAITGFTKCLQEDMADENIKVTAVYPGLMKTSLFEKNNVNRDLADALGPSEVADVVEYVINLSSSTYIPEISIKNKQNNPTKMDNTSAPAIDLNIDPNMIAAQDDPVQVTPAASAPVTTPIMPAQNSGVIDITPGSTDVFPSFSPTANRIDIAPPANSAATDITPQTTDPAPAPFAPTNPLPAPAEPTLPFTPPTSSQDSAPLDHLAPLEPEEPAEKTEPIQPAPVEPETPAPFMPMATPNTSAPIESSPQSAPPTTQSSPLAEDPDLVKIIK